MKRWKQLMMTLICGLIVSLSLTMFFTPDKVFSSEENRYLASFPTFSWESLFDGTFGKELETYVADQFPFRDYWVSAKARLEIAVNKKENNDVYAGKDDYLLQKIPNPEISLEEQMEYIQAFAEAIDIPVYFLLAPNSASVQSNQLPSFAPVPDQLAYIEEACSFLSDDAAYCVNIYHQLKKHSEEYIYYRTDHHWTTLGAFYAYQSFANAAGVTPAEEADFDIERVSNSFYGTLYARSKFRHINPDSIEVWYPKGEWTHNVTYLDSGDVSDSLYEWEHLESRDQYPIFLDGNHALTRIETPEAPDRTLLVIKDSYAHSFVPFLTQHYKNIYMADLRYLNVSMKDYVKDIAADDVLMLYNAATFQADDNLVKLKW